MTTPHFEIFKLLSDIHTSAERILVMLEKETLESFLSSSSMTVQDAVARRFTIIGEASAALLRKYPEFCQAHQEIPLRLARGMRNALVHDYDGIDWQILWETAQRELSALINAITPFLDKKP